MLVSLFELLCLDSLDGETDDEDDDDEESEECWDGGLEIAEQLVKHLQERRSNRVA